MKIIRYISFLLALLVLAGHDVIPHIDEVDGLVHEHDADHRLPGSAAQQESVPLEHIFSHLQHGTSDRNLVYLNSFEKKGDFQAKKIYDVPGHLQFGYRLTWYVNYKKQRFWDNDSPETDYLLHAFSLRGPPVC